MRCKAKIANHDMGDMMKLKRECEDGLTWLTQRRERLEWELSDVKDRIRVHKKELGDLDEVIRQTRAKRGGKGF